MIKAARAKGPQAGQAGPKGGVSHTALELARRVLTIEADAVRALVERIDDRFLAAIALILDRQGRVLVSGMGKSGHIARKIASTLSSTGTPAYFMHPAEASHGDVGMIQAGDVFIAISHSGESEELVTILPSIKRRGARLIALTGRPGSTLAKQADVLLDAAVAQEACPLNLAPTASTTAALALGDALAVALLDARGFSADDFHRSHPGGALGRLLAHVSDVMRKGDEVPRVPHTATLHEAILEVTRGRMGMTAVMDTHGKVCGIFTDGDLRRALEKNVDVAAVRVADVMTAHPRTIAADAIAAEVVQLMEKHKINQMLVVDQAGALLGALNMHDLFRAKVI
jgi:arabinose-5-phosphate isomerase